MSPLLTVGKIHDKDMASKYKFSNWCNMSWYTEGSMVCQTYSATVLIIHVVHYARAAAMTLRTVLLSIQALLQVVTLYKLQFSFCTPLLLTLWSYYLFCKSLLKVTFMFIVSFVWRHERLHRVSCNISLALFCMWEGMVMRRLADSSKSTSFVSHICVCYVYS